MIIMGIPIAHRGKGTGVSAQLIVGIDASLQRIEPLRLILRMFLERFYMIESQITTQGELRR